mmetsp:Transcript_53716/g.125215  ORF Transcript_53716/g.125215 Transcript_53716/m.125215 type:complete len:189 (-) Transcript_53716:96-662(-)
MAEQALEALSELLADRFGSRAWPSLKQWKLKVDDNGGTGLKLAATRFGYHVEAISDTPGQGSVQPGEVIVSVAGEVLLDLSEAELAETFGRHCRDGARLLLMELSELEEAQKSVEPQLLRVPVEVHVDPDAWASLQQDLAMMGEWFGVRADLVNHSVAGEVELEGTVDKVSSAQAELHQILQHYARPQ